MMREYVSAGEPVTRSTARALGPGVEASAPSPARIARTARTACLPYLRRLHRPSHRLRNDVDGLVEGWWVRALNVLVRQLAPLEVTCRSRRARHPAPGT